MSWNYRIVRYRDHAGLGLHEVYYDDAGEPWGMTAEAVRFVCDAEEGESGIVASLVQALADVRKYPVFDEPEVWPGADPTEGLGEFAEAPDFEADTEEVDDGEQVKREDGRNESM